MNQQERELRERQHRDHMNSMAGVGTCGRKQDVVTVNEAQARAMAARFTTYATDWAGEHAVYARAWEERASTLLAVADYLRDEPAAESVNFDEYAAIYWPVRVYRDDATAVHVCATCENRVPLSRERCDACNERIAAETAATINDQRTSKPCPFCGRDISEDSFSCPRCEHDHADVIHARSA